MTVALPARPFEPGVRPQVDRTAAGWTRSASTPRAFLLPDPDVKDVAPFLPPGSLAVLVTRADDPLAAALVEALEAGDATASETVARALDLRRKDAGGAPAGPPAVAFADLAYAGMPFLKDLSIDARIGFDFVVLEFPGAALDVARFSLDTGTRDAGVALTAVVLVKPARLNAVEQLAQRDLPPDAHVAGGPRVLIPQAR